MAALGKYTFIVTGGLLGSAVCAYRLWLPLSPIPFTPFAAVPLTIANAVVPLLLLTALAAVMLVRHAPKAGLVVGVAIGSAVFFNLQLLRADFYHYAVTFIMLGIWGVNSPSLLTALRLLHCGTYLWTGLHKLNPAFFELMQPFTKALLPTGAPAWWLYVVIAAVPLVEILVAVCWLTGKQVRGAVWLAVVLHAGIICQLLLSGWNESMITYNLFLAAGNVVLFYNQSGPVVKAADFTLKHIAVKITLALYGALPALAWVGWWPYNMSCAMYSGRAPYAVIYLVQKPDTNHPVAAFVHPAYGKYYLDVTRYMEHYTGATPNPQLLVYRRLQQRLCTQKPYLCGQLVTY